MAASEGFARARRPTVGVDVCIEKGEWKETMNKA